MILYGGIKKMSEETRVKTYRGLKSELVKEVQHLAIDTDRTEGDLINEALMLLLKEHGR